MAAHLRAAAFWTGLLYDEAALEAAWRLVKDWSAQERQSLRNDVPRGALKTRFRQGAVQDIAREAVRIAAGGLKARNRRNAKGEDERIFLSAIESIVASGRTWADDLLEHYETDWGGDIDRIFTEHAF